MLHDRCRGRVGAALDRPGLARVAASAAYRIEWPEATVATSARLDLRADAFEVELALEARGGDDPPWSRIWRRRIPGASADPAPTRPWRPDSGPRPLAPPLAPAA